MLTDHNLLTNLLDTLIQKNISVDVERDELILSGDLDALDAAEIDSIKQNKEALILWFLEHDTKMKSAIPRLDRQADKLFKASLAQSRIWFLDKLEGESSQYNMPFAYQINGEFNVQIAEKALDILIERHEPLRTCFYEDEVGNVLQNIQGDFTFSLNVVDFSFEPEQATRQQYMRQFFDEECIRRFDLSKDLMLRASCLKLGQTEYLLVLNIHHVATDGWSMKILLEEFNLTYNALLNNQTITLPALPIQYADYVHWLEHGAHNDRKQQQLTYWRNQLQGFSVVHNLPLMQPRPAVLTHEGSNHSFTIHQSELSDVLKIAKAKQMTPYMLLQGLFSLLISKFSNQTDVIVGTPVANRNRPELERLVGMFNDIRLVRLHCDPLGTLDEFLQQVKRINLEALANDAVTFADLIALVHPPRSLSHSPLFQLMFTYEYDVLEEVAPSELQLRSLTTELVRAKYELQLSVRQTSTGLACNFEYNSRLFSPETIIAMAIGYKRLVEQLRSCLSSSLADLSVLTPDHQKHLLVELNQTVVQFPSDKTLIDLLHNQLSLTPDAVALHYENLQLTYAQLHVRADRLAALLAEQGVKQNTVVGLLFERSVELVVSMLAIIKAGGAYLPLEPSYPRDRLNYMLNDSGAILVLCQFGHAHLVDSHDCLTVDRELELQIEGLERLPTHRATPDSLAYVIYTSGTTGRPKGVAVSHRALVNRIDWMQKALTLTSDDIVLQKTPISFDVSVWEFLLPFITGAALVLARPEGHKEPLYLVTLIHEKKVTTLHFVPSMLRAMIDSDKWQNCRSLTKIICSGEALTPDIVNAHFERLNVGLYNLYGPTEATIDVCAYYCAPGRIYNQVPIGKPINNIQLYVLDENRKLLPKGTTGELYIGGVGLAVGYINNSLLTDEKFVTNPFEQGKKLYRTGDLVCWAKDNNLIYQGRTDNQVKVRGFRIELGEIEQQLCNLPEVDSAAVIVRNDKSANPQLVAYLMTSDTSEQTQLIQGIKGRLRSYLPDYMVPQYYQVMDQLPLSANGKLDRKALPNFAVISGSELFAPQTELQKLLCEAFLEYCSVDNVGTKDNYFSIGGDSILALKTVAYINRQGVCVSLKDLFQYPTVEELALAIESGLAGDTEQIKEVAPFSLLSAEIQHQIDKSIFEDAYPLTYLQQGMVFLNEADSRAKRYQDQVKILMKQKWDTDLFQEVLQHLTRTHEVLRTEFGRLAGNLIQKVRILPEANIQVLDLRTMNADAQKQKLTTMIEQERVVRFSNNQLLWRLCAYRLTDDTTQITFTCHHAILDGWSIASFLKALAEGYEAKLQNRFSVSKYTAQTAKYNIYVANELKALNNPESAKYWQKEIDGVPTPWWTGSKLTKLKVSQLPISELEGRLVRLAASLGVPLQSLLLTAHLKLLSILNGTSQILSSSVSHGRSNNGGENTLGLFLNSAPVTLNTVNRSWRSMIEAVYLQQQEQKVHQHYPVAEIQRQTKTDFTGSLFNYIHFHVFESMVSQEHLSGEEDNRYLSLEHEADVNYNFISNFRHAKQFNQLVYEIRLHTDLFSDRHIEHINHLMFNILSDIVRYPDRQVQDHLLFPAMDQLVVKEQQNYQRLEFEFKNIMAAVSAQAVKSADNIAIVCNGKQISYGMLEEQANVLASMLIEQGITIGDRVALFMDRSYESVLSMLAVLKAGAVYVPINPSYPQDYITYIVSDAQIKVGLVLSGGQALLKVAGVQHLIEVDSIEVHETVQRTEMIKAITASITPAHSAYINYTSGTTGKPKGVEVCQAGILRLCQLPALSSSCLQRGFLHASSISFDATTLEVWGTLVRGNRLVVYADEIIDISRLNTLILNERISGMWLTSALFNQWVEQLPASVGHLERVIVGGDVVSPKAVIMAYEKLHNVEIVNGYGPTENTTFTCCYPIPRNFDSNSTIPIGKSIPGSYVYVVNNDLHQVPFGAVGELCTGGQGLAKGYLNLPDKTQEKFVLDPFSDDPNSRLYRTGDLVRYLEDGSLQFMGRLDDQIKLRGYRIEPTHVDATISVLPDVKQAITLLKHQESGDARLQTYVLPVLGCTTGPEKLLTLIKDHLHATLPSHLIPSAITIIDEIPLTHNGKIDKQQLLKTKSEMFSYELKSARTSASYHALKSCWSNILDIEISQLHPEADFFELGGHSLLANSLVRMIKEELQVTMKPVEVFEYSMLEKQYLYIENKCSDLQPGFQRHIAEIWRELMDLEDMSLSRDSDFFDLGGHSLQANRLVTAIKRRFDLDILPVDVFEYPTIEKLAVYLERQVDIVSPLTLVMRQIWMETLDLSFDEVNDSADFFELGGHSLLANKLVHKIEQQVGVKLKPVNIFETSRFGALLDKIEVFNTLEVRFLQAVLKLKWQQVLNVEERELTNDVDFFELGGHSLLANQLVTKLNDVFIVSLHTVDVFEHPTLSDMCEVIRSKLSYEFLCCLRVFATHWCQILDLVPTDEEQFGDFFELGGHSLLANRLVNALNNEFGCILQAADIFEYSSFLNLFSYMFDSIKHAKSDSKTMELSNVDEEQVELLL